MKKLLLIFTISLSLSIFFAMQTFAQQLKEPSIISVIATSTKSFAPDTAIIIIAVETKADSAREALSKNSIKADIVINKLKSVLKKDLGDLIKTSSYSMQPNYDYDENLKKNVFTGYSVVNQIEIKTKQINNIGNIIDLTVNSGATHVSGINFTIEDSKKYYPKVETEAVNLAKSQANSAAEALGLKVTGMSKMSVSSNEESSFRGMRMLNDGMAGGGAPGATPIEPGEVKIDSTVNIDFYAQ